MPVTYYGVKGASYEQVEEAWTDYFNELYADFGSMPAEEYHDKYLLFVSGILSGMNILSSRYQSLCQAGVTPDKALMRSMQFVLDESLRIAMEEYKQSGRVIDK